MSFSDYFEDCVALAMRYGFTRFQVEQFRFDLKEHWINGLKPQEAVDIEF